MALNMRVNRSIQDAARTRKTCGGFSLLELLAVMTIVAMLSTLAVTSYFSAIRGMEIRTACDSFYNALAMARQRACIDGCRVSVMIFNEAADFDPSSGDVSDLAASFVVCRELGRLSSVSGGGNRLVDEFSELPTLFRPKREADSETSAGAVKLYNLTQGAWTLVAPYYEETSSRANLIYSGGSFGIKAHALVRLTGKGTASGAGGRSGVDWRAGDSYGVEILPVKTLPKGFVFGELENTPASDKALTDLRSVTFEPDGTVSKAVVFTIRSRDQDPNAQRTTFRVTQEGDIQLN